MLCERLSLLTKRMRVPGLTVSVLGLTPEDEMVTVVPPPVEGDDGELPPQAVRPASIAAHSIRRTRTIITTGPLSCL